MAASLWKLRSIPVCLNEEEEEVGMGCKLVAAEPVPVKLAGSSVFPGLELFHLPWSMAWGSGGPLRRGSSFVAVLGT